ncbi:MAG TPA: beta-ketoacyl synthase chain length factor [Rhizomicrobium sp.]|nr:beta-ketoacyl synthase chain length factor [Rhizomicrobium sp.]
MSQFYNLQIGRWAFVFADGEACGTPSDEQRIPSALRRRMGRFERLAVRCTLGVLEQGPPTDELIFCSRYGNLDTLVSLLRSIRAREPVSPMAFSGSVHNTAPGLIGQILHERINHTAIAAGRNSFAAGLIESYARLTIGDCRDVTFAFADVELPEIYREFEDGDHPGVAVALRLSLAYQKEAVVVAATGGDGITRVLDGLKVGHRQIAISESLWTGADR